MKEHSEELHHLGNPTACLPSLGERPLAPSRSWSRLIHIVLDPHSLVLGQKKGAFVQYWRTSGHFHFQ